MSGLVKKIVCLLVGLFIGSACFAEYSMGQIMQLPSKYEEFRTSLLFKDDREKAAKRVVALREQRNNGELQISNPLAFFEDEKFTVEITMVNDYVENEIKRRKLTKVDSAPVDNNTIARIRVRDAEIGWVSANGEVDYTYSAWIANLNGEIMVWTDNEEEFFDKDFSAVCKLIIDGENIMAKSIYDIEENQARLFMTVINEIIKETQCGLYTGRTIKDFKKYGVTGRTLQILKKEHYITWHDEKDPVWISWKNKYYEDRTILLLKENWNCVMGWDIPLKVELTEEEVNKIIEARKNKEIEDACKKYDEMIEYMNSELF